MAKRYIAFFLSAVLLIACLTGCTSAENNSDAPTEITETSAPKVTDNTTFKLRVTVLIRLRLKLRIIRFYPLLFLSPFLTLTKITSLCRI